MDEPTQDEVLEFVSQDGPDIPILASEYRDTRSELEEFKTQCDENVNTRMCLWGGKARDNRKHSRMG